MNNKIRALTENEIQLVAGGYFGAFDIPDPVFKPENPPLPDVNPPKPDPSWYFIDPSAGIPIPEPANPGKGKP